MSVFEACARKLADALNKSGLDYALTGALAASFYGVPRTTADIDIIVAVPDRDAKDKLASALKQAGLEVDEKKINDALTSGYTIVTFKSKTSPLTVDIIVSGNIKKRSGPIAGVNTFFQAPEDLILAKLRMIKATVPRERTLKDEEDIKAILRFSEVDAEAVEKQAAKDKTLTIWKTLTKKS